MVRGYKYRLYPTREQGYIISQNFGSGKFVWNRLLEYQEKNYKEAKEYNESIKDDPNYKEKKKRTYVSRFDMNSYVVHTLKPQYDFLRECDSCVLEHVAVNLDLAFQKFFDNVKLAKSMGLPVTDDLGYPKYKKKGQGKSYTTRGSTIQVDVDNERVKLPKLGWVKMRLHRPIEGQIKAATISQVGSGKYYISFRVKSEDVINNLPKTNSTIGIDMGVKQYLTSTKYKDGKYVTTKYQNPKRYKRFEARKAFYNRQLDRRVKGSNRWKVTKRKLAKLYEQEAGNRKYFLNNLSKQIVEENDTIIIRDYKVNTLLKKNKKESDCNQQRKNLNKAQLDTGWYMFRQMLNYKCKEHGRDLKIVEEFFGTSQVCSKCGFQDEEVKDVEIREWTCPKCGAYHDREINATYNLLQETLGIKIKLNEKDIKVLEVK